MKSFFATVVLLCVAHWGMAQSFEGRFTYREQVGGSDRTVTIYTSPEKALVKRGSDKALFYLISAKSNQFSAWQSGSFKADEGKLNVWAKSAKNLVVKEETQIIAGFKAQPLKYQLADGSVFEGWYTAEVAFDHNIFVHRLLGHEWGKLPAQGVLLRWSLTDAKGRVVVSGELQSYQSGKQDPQLFVVPQMSDR